ncbi:hypothetical protein Sgly_2110 [Syntrophobotulus glycolicus DSM 8271]|uniref:Uncharacterized protein n=1 Tax=Syntrophobotulus glycolicus (strain DSM 8271 / FlGlyR) TaxID=645991 RepID=F0T257_SYNGF|nr:hypothetical protein [Syntrophobotulus glycolicus]ADY56401.1 hypothetical protein Sgly_2110 [Syntrophobotulus glycolicus DSM 8271]
MTLIEWIGTELILTTAGLLCLFSPKRGLFGAFLVLSILNFLFQDRDLFWRWELVIFLVTVIGTGAVLFCGRKSNLKQTVDLSFGGFGLSIFLIIFIALLPAMLIWFIIFGIPVFFTARHVEKKWLYLDIGTRILLTLFTVVLGNYLI